MLQTLIEVAPNLRWVELIIVHLAVVLQPVITQMRLVLLIEKAVDSKLLQEEATLGDHNSSQYIIVRFYFESLITFYI